LSGIAERVGADIERVRQGIGSDSRIGHAFIYPGAGYGGSCFPKDVQALRRTCSKKPARRRRRRLAVEEINERQKRVPFRTDRQNSLATRWRGRAIALWGLAFKPNTDDMRAASSRVLMQALAGGRSRGAARRTIRSR
jgi:UDPglucose 6-dehydrogenase